MAAFNHVVSVLVNPLVAGVFLVLLAAVLARRAAHGHDPCRRWAWRAGLAAAAWLWFWSTPLACWLLGRGFEAAYPPVAAESMPEADAIVVLGGGVSSGAEAGLPYPDLNPAADRVWHGVRLYRSGKAPRIVATGRDVSLSTLPLLRDSGVPDGDVTLLDGLRNTEEESRAVGRLLPPGSRILLVTSASHMRRALLLFGNAGLDAMPAATDHETTVRCGEGFYAGWLWPDPGCLDTACRLFKEHYAYWGYKVLRGF